MIFISYLRHSEGQESNVPIHGFWYPWGSGNRPSVIPRHGLQLKWEFLFIFSPLLPFPLPTLLQKLKKGARLVLVSLIKMLTEQDRWRKVYAACSSTEMLLI